MRMLACVIVISILQRKIVTCSCVSVGFLIFLTICDFALMVMCWRAHLDASHATVKITLSHKMHCVHMLSSTTQAKLFARNSLHSSTPPS